ncbi:DUF7282 domain-containing protein [Halobaculum sp. D14]|uniref:DUF7282 domain-containing protein n=1 Tax=unclassified Halobaculum TaxID=2640896 RepID=UPI003EC0111E
MKGRYLLSAMVLLSALTVLAPAAAAADTATATPAANESASIDYPDQQATESVTVESATLPDGGYVVVYNESGQPVGHTGYLDAGAHENVTVEVTPAFSRSQISVAQVHADDGDQTYEQANDTAYGTGAGAAVADTAFIRLSDSARTTTAAATTSADAGTTAAATSAETTSAGTTTATTPGFTAALGVVALAGAALLARR